MASATTRPRRTSPVARKTAWRRPKAAPPDTLAQPIEHARAAALRYVNDAVPGITRTRKSNGFAYHGTDGRAISDTAERARIAAIGIPPAWTDVWISSHANGHIQATGRDAKGRKQYRYHVKWSSLRGEHKFGRMIEFGAALPTIRARVTADLARADHSREKVLAVVVRLLETTYIRIGNEEYAKANGSFGLTTLRNRHARFSGDTLRFEFVGKMGKSHSIRVSDRRLARLVRRCRELPGQALFQYRDDAGETRAVDSTEVNAYIRELAGEEFTAKDFRTWAGSLLASSWLDHSEAEADDTSTSRTTGRLKIVLQAVSSQLGNTPAVCKSGYIHPLVLEAFSNDALQESWQRARQKSRARAALTLAESTMLTFLADNTATTQ